MFYNGSIFKILGEDMNYNFDYYAILGVKENATQQQIEEAYANFKEQEYKTASQWQRKQKEEAYNVLSNTETKAEYDSFRKKKNSNDSEADTDATTLMFLLLVIVNNVFLVMAGLVFVWFLFASFETTFSGGISWDWDNFKHCIKPCFCLLFLHYLSKIAQASTVIAKVLARK